mmetsp:Transcript_70798/g.224116  ORF Transcript_70798/g.224116 Transcript_70798/m.224116 type:complete len:313 (+) Transcript_70798:183-1121(+)
MFLIIVFFHFFLKGNALFTSCGGVCNLSLKYDPIPKDSIIISNKVDDISFSIFASKYDSGSLITSLNERGFFSPIITAIFLRILKGNCDQSKLMVDVGVNVGYFTNLAATLGCRVIGFEPQQRIHPLLQASLKINDLLNVVSVFPHGCSVQSKSVVMDQPASWGRTKILEKGVKAHKSSSSERNVQVKRLDAVVNSDVILMKVDVEGHEADVFAGATKLFREHIIENIILEVNIKDMAYKRLWSRFLRMGYTCFCFRDDDNSLPFPQAQKEMQSYGFDCSSRTGWKQMQGHIITDCFFSRDVKNMPWHSLTS